MKSAVIGSMLAFSLAGASLAQSALNGADLVLRSTGAAAGTAWTLDAPGYVGTYLQVEHAGTVAIDVAASSLAPARIRVAIADSNHLLEPGAAARVALHLPEGMYFLRIDSLGSQPVKIERIAIDGARIVNTHTDANALAVADTYIEHFRKGPSKVKLDGVSAGTKVRVRLKRLGFNLGTVAPNARAKREFADDVATGSDEYKFQQFINAHFNTLVPGNAGKWAYNEEQPGVPTMEYIDTIARYAQRHGMKMRMHALIWDTGQQPKWVIDLLDRASAGDESAKRELRSAISRRIGYYVRDRARNYIEMDVLNEVLHQPRYWRIFGAEGIAAIHREAADAVREAGASMTLFSNEYNVLQWSSDPLTKEPDPYANWYRRNVEQTIAAGGVVQGIGVQYYVDGRPDIADKSPHSPARILQAFQNLRSTGLPIELTEFGIQKTSDRELAGRFVDESMRMSFGSDGCLGFFVWGLRRPWVWDQAPDGILLDEQWQLTPAGAAFTKHHRTWNTDAAATVGIDGTISFTGYYGDYEIETERGAVPWAHRRRAGTATINSH